MSLAEEPPMWAEGVFKAPLTAVVEPWDGASRRDRHVGPASTPGPPIEAHGHAVRRRQRRPQPAVDANPYAAAAADSFPDPNSTNSRLSDLSSAALVSTEPAPQSV
jgi:hypothetical protein